MRNRFLGGVMPLMMYAPDDGTGAAAGAGGAAAAGGAAGGAAAGTAGTAGAGAGQAGAAAGAGAAGDAGAGAAGAGADAAAGTAAAGAGASLATGAVTDPVARAATPADWPADWREKAAGEDKGFLAQLKRYTDPVAALNWVRTQSLKISAGELRPTLKADASPEEVAEYRKSNGIPEKADAYVKDVKLPAGVVAGEADKPLLNSFAEAALAKNMPQGTFNDVVSWYFDNQNKMLADRAAADQDTKIDSQQKLIQTMGEDFRPNMNALTAFWKGQPEGVADMVLGARTADGRLLGNTAELTSWLAGVARDLNPAATLLPAGGEQGAKGVEGRIAEIEGQIYVDGKPNPAYYNGPMRKELRDLYDLREKMKTRAA